MSSDAIVSPEGGWQSNSEGPGTVDRNFTGLVREVPAMIERAVAKWEEAPKHLDHARPAGSGQAPDPA